MGEKPLEAEALDSYLKFLRAESVRCTEGDAHYLALPFTLASGHTATVALRHRLADFIEVSDDGAAVADLGLATSNLPRDIMKRVDEAAEVYDCIVKDGLIQTAVKPTNLGDAIHRVLQCRLRVGDLLLLERVYSRGEAPLARRVREEVFEPRFKEALRPYVGKTVDGADESHRVDFLFNSTANVAIKTIDSKKYLGLHVDAWAFKWKDIQEKNPALRTVSIIDESNPSWTEKRRRLADKSVDQCVDIQDKKALVAITDRIAPSMSDDAVQQ